jgi:hypothetical protein
MPNFSVATEIDLMSLTIIPTAPLARGLFVGVDGNVNAAGARAKGISRVGDVSAADVALGREAVVGVEGLFALIVGTAFAKGAEITSDAAGKGITAVRGDYVNAIAEEQGVTAGDVVMVRRVSYKLAGSVAPLTGVLTGTADGAMVNVAAAAAATAGGATPSAAQVDAGIATALAPVVAGVNEQLKELETKLNALINSLG